MKHPSDHIQQIFIRHAYPDVAIKAINALESRIAADPILLKRYESAVFAVMGSEEVPPYAHVKNYESLSVVLKSIYAIANDYALDRELLSFIFLLDASEILRSQYALSGLPDELFWDSITDFRYKLNECMEVRGKPGTFVEWWNEGLLRMTRFTYGRFQYEVVNFGHDDFVSKSGKIVKRGSPVVTFHIPSSGIPLTDDVRHASYRMAAKQYRHLFPDGHVVLHCHSWLLYPRHREFLPPQSNILHFMNDFEMVASNECDKFGDAWRIFGAAAQLPPSEWPRKTSLQRAYADWINAGNKSGEGEGIIIL